MEVNNEADSVENEQPYVKREAEEYCRKQGTDTNKEACSLDTHHNPTDSHRFTQDEHCALADQCISDDGDKHDQHGCASQIKEEQGLDDDAYENVSHCVSESLQYSLGNDNEDDTVLEKSDDNECDPDYATSKNAKKSKLQWKAGNKRKKKRTPKINPEGMSRLGRNRAYRCHDCWLEGLGNVGFHSVDELVAHKTNDHFGESTNRIHDPDTEAEVRSSPGQPLTLQPEPLYQCDICFSWNIPTRSPYISELTSHIKKEHNHYDNYYTYISLVSNQCSTTRHPLPFTKAPSMLRTVGNNKSKVDDFKRRRSSPKHTEGKALAAICYECKLCLSQGTVYNGQDLDTIIRHVADQHHEAKHKSMAEILVGKRIFTDGHVELFVPHKTSVNEIKRDVDEAEYTDKETNMKIYMYMSLADNVMSSLQTSDEEGPKLEKYQSSSPDCESFKNLQHRKIDNNRQEDSEPKTSLDINKQITPRKTEKICSHCCINFETTEDLVDHINMVHNSTEVGKDIVTIALYGWGFECASCDVSLAAVNTHLSKHKKEQVQGYCSTCMLHFGDVHNLVSHASVCHALIVDQTDHALPIKTEPVSEDEMEEDLSSREDSYLHSTNNNQHMMMVDYKQNGFLQEVEQGSSHSRSHSPFIHSHKPSELNVDIPVSQTSDTLTKGTREKGKRRKAKKSVNLDQCYSSPELLEQNSTEVNINDTSSTIKYNRNNKVKKAYTNSAEKFYRCGVYKCRRRFSTMTEVLHHRSLVHNEECFVTAEKQQSSKPAQFKCNECYMMFGTPSLLLQHKVECHQDKPKDIRVSLAMNPDPSKVFRQNISRENSSELCRENMSRGSHDTYQCKACFDFLPDLPSVQKHLLYVHAITNEDLLCHLYIRIPNIGPPLRPRVATAVTSSVAIATVSSATTATPSNDIPTMTTGKPDVLPKKVTDRRKGTYKCRHCNLRFASPTILLDHVVSAHVQT